MPSINTSDITRVSDSTYFVDIARVKKLHLLTYFKPMMVMGHAYARQQQMVLSNTYVKYLYVHMMSGI